MTSDQQSVLTSSCCFVLQVSDESLPTFNDQLRLMGYSGSPGDINDLTPPHQRVMFNSYLNSANGNNYFTGYEGKRNCVHEVG